MKHLLLAFFLTAAVPVHAGPEHRDSGKHLSVEELTKNAAALEEAVKQAPADIELHIRLGFTYTRLEKADDAQKAFENAVRLDPKRAVAHYMLGLIYEKKGLREKAIAAWEACLKNATEPHGRETAIKHLHHLRTN